MKELNRQFCDGDIQMANRHRKRFAALFIREMQITMTMEYHLTSVKMSIIKKTEEKKKREDSKSQQRCEEKRVRVHFWCECKLVYPYRKQYGDYLKN